ncbi:MAG: hypothetical protein M1814_003519 [Vezdaea aestivalis]|nr:MAG: hypothetical protein M1814_003519 [Vezdaea aestivalis]
MDLGATARNIGDRIRPLFNRRTSSSVQYRRLDEASTDSSSSSSHLLMDHSRSPVESGHKLDDVSPTTYANDAPRESVESLRTLSGLTLFEKKAMLVNQELDAMGMGRYQWMLWFLCGFGYFLDLLWAEALALIASPMQKEMGFSDSDLANLFVAFSAGLCSGAFIWGVLVDVIGRYWAFNCTVLIASIPGILLGVPTTYDPILVLAAITGIGVGGNIPIDTTIMLEFLPQNKRYLLPLLSIFQPLGVVVTCLVSYAFIPVHVCKTGLKACSRTPAGQACCLKADNQGWRYVMFTLGGITFFIFFMRFALFRFQESPKWLLSKGRDKEALKSLHYVAKFNKRPCDLTLATFEALSTDTSSAESDEIRAAKRTLGGGSAQRHAPLKDKILLEFDRIKILFSSPTMTRLTLLTWIIYAFDYWGFTIAGKFLPTIIARKDALVALPLRTTYRNYILIYFPGIFGVLLGVVMWQAPRVGRQVTMIISSALMGMSLFLYATITTRASSIGFNVMEYFFQSLFNAVLYGWTPEAFPAPIRGTATGVASFWGRLFGIISPLIAGHLLATGPNNVLYLAGGGVFVCTVAICFLPRSKIGAASL